MDPWYKQVGFNFITVINYLFMTLAFRLWPTSGKKDMPRKPLVTQTLGTNFCALFVLERLRNVSLFSP